MACDIRPSADVWEGNESAYQFYKNMGMRIQKTGMETIL